LISQRVSRAQNILTPYRGLKEVFADHDHGSDLESLPDTSEVI